MKVLVTGAAGFVGSALIQAPARGKILTGLYHPSRQHDAGIDVSITTCFLDLTTASIPIDATEPVDVIVHLAARIPSVGNDEAAAAANRTIDDNVITYCQQFPQTRLVFFSSSSIYNGTSGTWHENSDVSPSSSYSREKLATERRIQRDVRSFDIIRLNAPYGCGQRNETVVTRFINQATRNETLELYGDGSRKQAFTHVDDVIELVHALLDVPPTMTVLNAAGNELVTMRDLASTVLTALPSSSSAIVLRPDVEDVFVTIVPDIDCSRARELTGWRSKITLAAGIEDTAKCSTLQESNRAEENTT